MRDTAEFSSDAFEKQNDNSGVYARFYLEAVRNEAKSAEEGRPIFEDREFVEIIAAGNSTNIVVKPVRLNEIRRFPKEYAKFKDGEKDQLIGTPLGEIPWMTKSMVEELNHLKVRTLEHLAVLNDDICGRYAGLYEAKRKAGIWLQAAKEAQPFTRLEAENLELRERLSGMESQMAELIALQKQANAGKKS